MEVTSVNTRPNYNATKKGALTGAVVSGTTGAALTGLVSASTMALGKNPTIAMKKEFINELGNQYSRMGIDMSKTTVSKIIKGAKSAMKSPVTIVTGLVGGAIAGAGIGLVVDLIKNQHSKKSSQT